MTGSRLGVGFIGAGPVTQAIHLPTLARLDRGFRIVRVMDVDERIARSVASRVDADWSTEVESITEASDVDVVVIGSPHRFHSAQAIAAARAGKRAVLCEKPLAVTAEDAEQVRAAFAETGVPLVIGAMHLFDPAWRAVSAAWGDLPATAHTIRNSIVLPPNPRFEDFAAEVIQRPVLPGRDRRDPEVAGRMIWDGVMGLAVHDLPLIRVFCPVFDDVVVRSAFVPPPSGYRIDLGVGGRAVQVAAVNTLGWQPDWTLDVIADDVALHVDFPPSYVQAGSATVTLVEGNHRRTFGPYSTNGYEAEWRYIADVVAGVAPPPDPVVAVDDVRFALTIADGASEAARSFAVEEARR